MTTDIKQSGGSLRGGPIMDRRVTEELAEFCVTLSANKIPASVIENAKYFAFDFAGVALRGSQEASSRVVFDTISMIDGVATHGSTVIGHAARMSPVWASFANGSSAHALELDDTHQEGSIHPGVVVFPAALAIAEAENSSGHELLAAAVVGYDVACRLAMALRPGEHYAHGFHPTATCGVFSSAAVAARLMDLTIEQTVNAFGIAGSQAAGSLEFLADGTWTKRFHPGWASHAGIMAALLARNGFTGPHRILEGKSGFLRSYSDNPDVGRVVAGLGANFEMSRTSIKPHACCRYNQAPIDGVLRLVSLHNIAPDDIDEINIGMLNVGFPIVAEPVTQKRRPASVVDAQFSVHFAVAVAVLNRQVGLSEYQVENLHAPEIIALMDRVTCEPAPDLDALFPQQWSARVEIVLRDGRRYEDTINYPKGDPENPLSWDELHDKFMELVSDIGATERTAQTLALARRLDQMPACVFASSLG